MSTFLELSVLPDRFHWPLDAADFALPTQTTPGSPDPEWLPLCQERSRHQILDEDWEIMEATVLATLPDSVVRRLDHGLWAIHGAEAHTLNQALYQMGPAPMRAAEAAASRRHGWPLWSLLDGIAHIRRILLQHSDAIPAQRVGLIRCDQWGKY